MSQGELDPVAEQAIAWLVRLRSGRAEAGQQARLQAWLDADPAHGRAWRQLQDSLGGPYEILRRAPTELREPLLRTERGRRDVLRGLAGLGLFAGGLWLASRSDQGRVWLADLRSGVGQRRDLRLSDGSHLWLDADSAVDLDFRDDLRLLHLHRGKLLVQVAADPRRPLLVRTRQGEARALGTRFLVERQAASTRVVVLQHAVRASLPQGAWLDLQEGQGALLHTDHIEPLAGDQRHRADWRAGRLSVLDEPLEAVIAALRPYRPGLLRIAPEVRRLRVQGVFPLDDSERALDALAETLPIRVERHGAWLTLIEPR